MSCWPHITACTAKSSACWLDPHARFTVVPGMCSGQPAASTEYRPMLLDWSPTWETQPQITSSTTSGSTPVRSASSLSTSADRSAACCSDNPPLRLPTGVRTAPTMTVSRIALFPSSLRVLRTDHPVGTQHREFCCAEAHFAEHRVRVFAETGN